MPAESTDVIQRLNAALEGRYAIERELGEGGMATVYLAEDLRHERKVALKVLKPELAAVVGGERFLAEIKTTANLQHPHILPLHDSGEADGFLYYVMPYVTGESLRAKLDREHQLPVDDAVRISTAVASALDFAHWQGVIHRDIKPANILLHDGQPIVADFGIALAVGALGGDRLTETGLSVGTPHYMSPEQATGDQTVGPATDIYALGCVLCEMLVGDPPYTGSSPQIILGKIIAGEPDSVRAQRKSVPENVDATVRRALERLPADRFTSAAAFGDALGDLSYRYREAAAPAVASRLWNPLSVALAAVVMVLVGLLGKELLDNPAGVPEVKRYVLSLGGNDAREVEYGSAIALSPDGSKLAYVGVLEDGDRVLLLKESNKLLPRALPQVGHPLQPFFSPDGERIGVNRFGDGPSPFGLGTVTLATGDISAIADSGVWWGGGAWSDDGWIYVQGSDATIVRFSERGEREPVTTLAEGELEHLFPELLPGGRGLLFTIWYESPQFEGAEVAVVAFETGRHTVLAPGNRAVYSETGHLIVLHSDGRAVAAPFDAESLEMTGRLQRVLDGIKVGRFAGFDFALSASGDLVYVAGEGGAIKRELVWVGRDGVTQPFEAGWLDDFESVAFSPTGDRVAIAIGSPLQSNIWMKPVGEGPPTRFTFETGSNRRPVWMPNGDSIAFISDRDGNRNLYAKRADGAGLDLTLLDLPRHVDQVSFSPDGSWMAYRVGITVGSRDIYARQLGPDSSIVVISAQPGVDEYSPAVSPDGRYVAYVSSETGRDEVWVRPFPDVQGGRWQVLHGGGEEPVWAHGSGELFYRSPSHMIAVRVSTDPTFGIVAVDTLFSAVQYRRHGLHPSYDVSPDDQRLLMIGNPPTVSEFVVVEHFGQELIDKVGR